jgi:hypothetical protein
MNFIDREQRMLQLIDQYREDECRKLQRQTRDTVAHILAEARAEARTRLRRAIVAERQRQQLRLGHAQANLVTQRRRHDQTRLRRLLHQAWALLGPELGERWRDQTWRRQWVKVCARQAAVLLSDGDWRVEHPPLWDASDRDVFLDALANRVSRAPSFAPNPALTAGLVIQAERVVLDLSDAGLLADRSLIESRLLALYRELETPT